MSESKKNFQNIEVSIYSLAKKLSLIFILVAIIGFGILLLPLVFRNYDYSKLGSLGDATGGFLNPVIAIAGALLTFLAFYVQYRANTQIEKQFEQQKINDAQNFEYTRIKERIHLVMKEIDDFEIAFHEGGLISKLNNIPSSKGKKYNFKGIQGLNLFLIELYRNKKSEKIDLEDSYHSIAMNIENLIVLFYNTHKSLQGSNLDEVYKKDLSELMTYLYQSKLSYMTKTYLKNLPEKYKLYSFLTELRQDYSNQAK